MQRTSARIPYLQLESDVRKAAPSCQTSPFNCACISSLYSKEKGILEGYDQKATIALAIVLPLQGLC